MPNNLTEYSLSEAFFSYKLVIIYGFYLSFLFVVPYCLFGVIYSVAT